MAFTDLFSRTPTMAVRLRRKFIITAMAALLIIVVLMIGVINFANLYQIDSRTENLMSMLRSNDGRFPVRFDKSPMDAASDNADASSSGTSQSSTDGSPSSLQNTPLGGPPANSEYRRRIEAPYETRYFNVRMDKDGNVIDTFMEHIASITEEEARQYGKTIAASGKVSGYYGTYKFCRVNLDDGGVMIIFVDCNSSFAAAQNLFLMSLLAGFIALILMFILVWLLSGYAIAPVMESLEKQKRFISDAGHELKTPLSVISANIDVIEITGGKSEWTKSVRNQIKRMTGLINNMLTLTRMEEDSIKNIFTDTDFSSIVKENAQIYEAVAQSHGKEYSADIAEGIHVHGDPRSLTQLCTLLLDNAMKYSDEGGTIHVQLSADKKVHLEIANTCSNMPEGDLDRLFDRFYRADASRNSRTGGYGIGLSAARAICISHGGSIRAVRDGDRIIRFLVTLPLLPKQPSGRKISADAKEQ